MDKSKSLNEITKKWNGLRFIGLSVSILQTIIFFISIGLSAKNTSFNAITIFLIILNIIILITSAILIFISKNNSKVLCGVLSLFMPSIIPLFFWIFSKPKYDINAVVRQMVHNEINQSQSMNHKDLNNQDNNEWL